MGSEYPAELGERPIHGHRTAPFKASIDRIDSTRGYTRDNCRLVCWFVNQALERLRRGRLLEGRDHCKDHWRIPEAT